VIIAGLVISSLVFAAFLVIVIGIRGSEKHHRLCNPYADGLTGTLARRVLGVYVRQIEVHDQDHEDCYGQKRN